MIVKYNNMDISEYITKIVWSGNTGEKARKLEFNVVNAPHDINIAPLTLELAGEVMLLDDNNKELFRGFILKRSKSSNTGDIPYLAYDLCYFLNKSKATYNFTDKTAETIVRAICNDFGVPVGSLAETGISQKLMDEDQTVIDFFIMAYTQAHDKNNKDYYVYASEGKLCVGEMGKVVSTIDLTEDVNILSSEYEETLDNMVNRVKIYDNAGNSTGVVENTPDLKYGIFQAVYVKEDGVDPITAAKALYHSIDKSYDFECLNINEIITGVGVKIIDNTSGLSGLVWVDSDTHTWDKGKETMKLTVTLKQVMETKEPKAEEESSTDSKSSSGDSGKIISFARQYIGKVPYVWGGYSPKGFDCSGFVSYVFLHCGVKTKITQRLTSQALYAASTKHKTPKPGDIVFFENGAIDHIGICIGNGRMIECASGVGVRESAITQGVTKGGHIGGYGSLLK